MYTISGSLNTGWPIGRLFPGENFRLLSAFLNRLEFLVSNWGSMGFPPSVFVSVSTILVQVWCRQLYWWDSMSVAFLMFLEETISKPTSSFTDYIVFLPPLLKRNLSLRCKSCIVHVSGGSGHHTIACSLYLDWLWFSVMISTCCNSFFGERWKLRLSLGMRTIFII